MVLAQTQECSTYGVKVMSVVTLNNINYGSIQYSLIGKYPIVMLMESTTIVAPTHPSWPSKKRGGGGEGESS